MTTATITPTSRMTWAEIDAEVRALPIADLIAGRCRHCRGTGWITCPDHCAPGNSEIDPATGYVWCWSCDSAEIAPPQTSCPCSCID
ncbi:hypothetical protein AB0M91_23690 [Micromonospora rifamycinica]|uniref:hypothetical protein n=1 Tax=Micromonospora rifamycinica TaxID=291594 RepID=UPI00344276F1